MAEQNPVFSQPESQPELGWKNFISGDFDKISTSLWNEYFAKLLVILKDAGFKKTINDYLANQGLNSKEVKEKVSRVRQRSLFFLSLIVFFHSEEKLPESLLRFCTALGDWKDRFDENTNQPNEMREDLERAIGEIEVLISDLKRLDEIQIKESTFQAAIATRKASIKKYLSRTELTADELHTLRKQLRNFFHLFVQIFESKKIELSEDEKQYFTGLIASTRFINQELGKIRDQFLLSELLTNQESPNRFKLPDNLRQAIEDFLKSF